MWCLISCKQSHQLHDKYSTHVSSENINFRYEGEFLHEWGDSECNQIAYERRRNFRKDLTHRTGDHLATEINARADMDLVECGNANPLMSVKKLNQIRHEVQLKPVVCLHCVYS